MQGKYTTNFFYFFVIPLKYFRMISFGLEGSTVSDCNEIVILTLETDFFGWRVVILY